MNTYKITNITNLAGKRDINYNKVLDIVYLNNRIKQVKKLKAGQDMFLSIPSLPLSVHRLRIKGLISISEVSAAELAKSMKTTKPKATRKAKVGKKNPAVAKKEVVADVKEELVAVVTEEEAAPPKKKTTRKTTVKKA
jgi:hypothetical protein